MLSLILILLFCSKLVANTIYERRDETRDIKNKPDIKYWSKDILKCSVFI